MALITPTDPLTTTPAKPPAHRSMSNYRIALGIATAAVIVVLWSMLTRPDDQAEPLPDPAPMLTNSIGKPIAADYLAYWATRAVETPEDVVVLTSLGNAQLTFASEMGDLAAYEEAEESFRAALRHNPSSGAATLGLASAVSAQHGFVEAQQIIENQTFRASLLTAELTAKGDAALELGEYQQAQNFFRQVSGLTPGEPSIDSRLARVAYLNGDTPQAIELSEQALRAVADLDLRPADAAFYWFQLANYQWRNGDTAAALANLDNALAVFPNHLGSLELYGHVLVSEGRLDEAITAFEGLVVGGGAADLHGELEKLYTATGQPALAAEQDQLGRAAAAVQIDEFVAERRHLIDFYADHDPAVALELAQLDFADRQDIYSHDALAWTLYLNGEIDQAAEHAEQALDLGTNEAKLWYHAGMISLAYGATEVGQERLQTALDIDPNFDAIHAAKAREALASS